MPNFLKKKAVIINTLREQFSEIELSGKYGKIFELWQLKLFG